MLWRPLAFTPQQKSDEQRHNNNYQNIARLKPGARDRARAAADRRAQRAQPRSVSRAQAAADQRRLPHHRRPAAGHAGPRDQGDALSDVGRRAVRAADRLRQRRQPRAGAIARAAEGAGDAARARRRDAGASARQLVTESVLLTMIAAAAGLLVGYAALQLLGTLNIQELPRGEEIRLDGVVVAYTLAVAAVIGFVLGLIPVANVLPANLTIVLREEGRSGTAGRGARALRRTLVVAQVALRVRAADRRRPAVRELPAACSRSSPASIADGVLTASVSLPRARYTERQGADRLHARGAAAAARAARRHRRRRDRHDSVRRQQQRQRDLRRGLPDEAGRVGDLAERRSTSRPATSRRWACALLRGRFFDERDGAEALKKAAAAASRRHRARSSSTRRWRSASGRTRIRSAGACTSRATSPAAISPRSPRRPYFFTVVGVIADIKLHDLTEGAKSVGAYYFPIDQDTSVGHDVRDQDRRRSAVADQRGARRAQRPRSRAAGLRHADDGAADGEVAGHPQVAGAAVAQLRRGRARACRRSASTACWPIW